MIEWLANYNVYLPSGKKSGNRQVHFKAPDHLMQYDDEIWQLATVAAAELDEVDVYRIHINEVDALD